MMPCLPVSVLYVSARQIDLIVSRGIATVLLEQCITDVKAQGMVGIHLITAGEGVLPGFYESFGFKRENEVILMGMEL